MKTKTCAPNKNVNKLVLLMNFERERERERESQLFPTIRNSQLFQFLSFILFLTSVPLYSLRPTLFVLYSILGYLKILSYF